MSDTNSSSGRGWSSVNNNNTTHMNNRPNSRVRSVMVNSAPRSKNQDFEINGIYKNAPFTFHLSTLIGSVVHVKVKSGKSYEGIFKTFSPELAVVLECVHALCDVKEDGLPTKDKVFPRLIFSTDEWVKVTAADADTRYGESDSFTDTGISKAHVNGVVKEGDLKELKPWDDGGIDAPQLEEASSLGWDAEEMFKKNEEKFGVKSTFDDSLELYTTKLEKSDTPDYHKRMAEAERLASEIESSSASRRNTALENSDDLDEETKFSAVIRQQPHHTSGASSIPGSNPSRSSRYLPPQRRDERRDVAQVQLSQSARLNGRELGLRKSQTQKPSKPPENIEKQKLKDFQTNFKLGTTTSNLEFEQKSPIKMEQKPSGTSQHVQGLDTDKASPSTVKPTVTQTPVPAAEPVMTKSEIAPMASSPPSASPAVPVTESSVNTVSEADKTPKSEPVSASASSETRSVTDVSQSKLNPEAKEFVYNPQGRSVVSSQPHAVIQQYPMQPQQSYPKSKTATVSVVDAQRRSEMPTAAQAMGPPLINSNPHAPPAQSFAGSYVVVSQPPPRVQRVPSYNSSEGQANPAHSMFATQQQFLHGPAAYVHGGMPGPMALTQPMQQGNMSGHVPSAPPAHNAQLQVAQQQGHQAQPPPPPHSAAGMNNGASTVNNQHVIPQHPPYPQNNHGSGVPYMYQTTQPHQTQQQPPLQPSPHNPSPSPVAINNGAGAPVVTSYPNYAPPQSQQFYPVQGPTGAAAVSQAAQYPHGPQNIIFVQQTGIPGQYAHPLLYNPVQGYPHHFQP